MSKRNAAVMERELQMYWRLARDAAAIERQNARDPDLELTIEELDTMREYTDWPRLKEVIHNHVTRHTQKRKNRLVVVCAS